MREAEIPLGVKSPFLPLARGEESRLLPQALEVQLGQRRSRV